jgi:glutamate-1-semialdehyde 2,1-aminomutase
MNIHAGTTAHPGAAARERIVAAYRQRTPRSAALRSSAAKLLPGGINRNIVNLDPHPLFVMRGEGAHLFDEDGNRYLDCIGNYTSMVIGHTHPAVEAAVIAQVKLGSAWAAASACEAELAAAIAQRVPSMERVRFTASGSEAVMMAVRAARAFTGRPLVAKFEGGYHGLHDIAMVSMAPAIADAGPAHSPLAVAPAGIPDAVRDAVIVLPFNDIEAVRRIVLRHAPDIACILVEPVPGVAGVLLPEAGFLTGLRTLAEEVGCLLVFDEVISFRVAYGGAQEQFGVRPDLTTLGKIIGGGYPIGAIGGRVDVMELFAPGGKVGLSGTFHANPVVCAAGLANLRVFDRNAVASLNALAAEFIDALGAMMRRKQEPRQLNAIGSLFNIHATAKPVRNYRDAQQGDKEFVRYLYLALLNEGVMLSPRGMGALSTAMTRKDTDFLLAAIENSVDQLCGG